EFARSFGIGQRGGVRCNTSTGHDGNGVHDSAARTFVYLMKIEKYSIGVGDRFAHQAEAQLRACLLAQHNGVEVIPVWNKSNREHITIGSEPVTTRVAADAAVKALGWKLPYQVDADHIRLETVDRFVPHSDFFTIDVADWIGKPAD